MKPKLGLDTKITRAKLRRTIKEYVVISMGLLLFSFSWTSIIAPAGIAGGGIGGISQLVYWATGGTNGGIPIGYTFFIANAILLFIASFIIGPHFGAKTIYAIVFISFAMGIMQQWIPFNVLELADDKLMSTILGGALAGLGVSICFTQGGSTGGTDIIAMVINKYHKISYGRIVIMCDFIIIGVSVLVFKNISAMIYGYVLVGVFGYTVDAVLAGNKQSSQIFIISKEHELIASRISSEVRRGVTILDGQGWYTKEKLQVVMVVCRKNETSTLFRVIKECDPGAFITVGSVMGVYGLGFESLKK